MLWIYFDRQGVAKCKVNSGNKIRQGDSFELAIYVEGTNEGTEGGWGVYSISYIKPDSVSPIGLTAPAQTDDETYYLGDPSQANFYFKNGTTYKVWKATVPSTATSIVSNGGNLGLIITLSDTPSSTSTSVSQKRMETISVYLEPTYGSKPLSMTYDDYSNLIKLYTNYDPVFVHGTGANAAQQIGTTGTGASGTQSVSMNCTAVASGGQSLAAGYNTLADAAFMTAIGRYNKSGSGSVDTLFAVGNGTDEDHRSNAFQVLSDGRAKVQGDPTENDDVLTLKYMSKGGALDNAYVWKSHGSGSEVQYVYSGIRSVQSSGNKYVTFGSIGPISTSTSEDSIGFSVIVGNFASTNSYNGRISLEAKKIYLATSPAIDGKQVYALFADTNTTALYSPTGTSSIVLGSGSAVVDANTFSLYSGRSAKFVLANGNSLTAYVPLSLKTDPAEDDQATHKKYVDNLVSNAVNTEQTRAQEKETSLQEQINAIQESQNFVATYDTEDDMPSAPSIEANDCVLVLHSNLEAHLNQAVVYKWTGSAWEFVGELGSSYTKAQIDEMFLNDQHMFVSEDGYVCVDYDKLPVRNA